MRPLSLPLPVGPIASRRGSTADDFDRALRLYRRRSARCRTENQWNRLHIAIENYLTPLEVRRFEAAFASEQRDSPGRAWMARITAMLPRRRVRDVEFERAGSRREVSMYTAKTSHPARKTLIVAFAGHFNRLMAPMPVLLDCLNPAAYDVLVLRDFGRRFFATGVVGLGRDLTAAMSSLKTRYDPASYRSAIALGTSSGGLAALLAAIALGLERGVSLGAMDVATTGARLRERGLSDAAFADLLAARPRPFPDLVLAFGAGFEADAAAARALHERLPSRLFAVEGCRIHALIGWHLARGRLPSFLAAVLGRDLETGDPIAAPATA